MSRADWEKYICDERELAALRVIFAAEATDVLSSHPDGKIRNNAAIRMFRDLRCQSVESNRERARGLMMEAGKSDLDLDQAFDGFSEAVKTWRRESAGEEQVA